MAILSEGPGHEKRPTDPARPAPLPSSAPRSLTNPPATEPPSSPESDSVTADTIYSLLASANLARMRGEWDAALEKCAQALQSNPDDANAHSLLGDVYSDQGRREEAIQWYRMALDLDPENLADRRKMDRLRQAPAPPGDAALPPSWIRVMVTVGSIAVLLLIGVGIRAFLTVGTLGLPLNGKMEEPPPLTLPPGLRPPAPLPPVAPRLSHLPARPAPTPQGAETFREARLREAFEREPLVTGEPSALLSLTSALVDPSEATATVSFLAATRTALQTTTALSILYNGVGRCFTADPIVSGVTIRLLYRPVPERPVEVMVVGVSPRSQYQGARGPLAAFSSLWWNPKFYPPALNAPVNRTIGAGPGQPDLLIPASPSPAAPALDTAPAPTPAPGATTARLAPLSVMGATSG